MTNFNGRSFTFTHTVSRLPGKSIASGLRAGDQTDPDYLKFLNEHENYIAALKTAGVDATVLPAQEAFPDSVFVEDAALCFGRQAVILRPGAPSRFGEGAAITDELLEVIGKIVSMPASGFVDGGDVLLTDTHAMIGLSDRTNQEGITALQPLLAADGYEVQIVHTPNGVLHFKSDCGLLDSNTIFSTNALAASGCFDGYKVVETPVGEEEAANLIRVNDYVIMRTGFPKTQSLLESLGYNVLALEMNEAPKVDGGLSCMSLRFAL